MKRKITIIIFGLFLVSGVYFGLYHISTLKSGTEAIGEDGNKAHIIIIIDYYIDIKKLILFNGTCSSIFKNGNVEYTNKIKNGRSEIVTSYYNNGKKKSEFRFKNNVFNGISKTWFENGKLYRKGNYKNDLKNGIFEVWYENGNKKDKREFLNDIRNGSLEIWYENGNKKVEAYYANGKVIGEYRTWYSNGNRQSHISFKNDRERETKVWDNKKNLLDLNKKESIEYIKNLMK